MKKLYLLFMSFLILCSCSSFADSPCNKEASKAYESQCPKECNNACPSNCFLCTNKNSDILFKEIGLSETQICTAIKIQNKYEQEVMSLNEKLQCEEQKLNVLNSKCIKGKSLREQRRIIKDLKKKRKEICKCYEKQFESFLSDDQKRMYKKHKKYN